MTDKTCTSCKQTKAIEEFYKSDRYHCIECERKSAKERMREYYQTARGKASQALGDSKKAVKRIEEEQGITIKNTLTVEEVEAIFISEECAYCGEHIEERERTLDHVTPMRHGGENSHANCVMACADCNRLKNDMPVLLFMLKNSDADNVYKVFLELSERRNGASFAKLYAELAEHAKNFYDMQTAKAIERIEKKEKDEEEAI